MRNLPVLVLVLLYGAASFLHHAHNARFLRDYPNMPAWISAASVYSAWLGTTAIGVLGYLLWRSDSERA